MAPWGFWLGKRQSRCLTSVPCLSPGPGSALSRGMLRGLQVCAPSPQPGLQVSAEWGGSPPGGSQTRVGPVLGQGHPSVRPVLARGTSPTAALHRSLCPPPAHRLVRTQAASTAPGAPCNWSALTALEGRASRWGSGDRWCPPPGPWPGAASEPLRGPAGQGRGRLPLRLPSGGPWRWSEGNVVGSQGTVWCVLGAVGQG